MHISADEIEEKKTVKGGWTKKQLAEWGINWPPQKGWKEALINGTSVQKAVKEVKIDKSEEQELQWYHYLKQHGFKTIVQIKQGKETYNGSIENAILRIHSKETKAK